MCVTKERRKIRLSLTLTILCWAQPFCFIKVKASRNKKDIFQNFFYFVWIILLANGDYAGIVAVH